MNMWKKTIAMALVLCLIASVLPVTAMAAVEQDYTYAPVGNTGAVITVTGGDVVSAAVDAPELAAVTTAGNVVTVTGAADAVGVAAVTIAYGDGETCCVEVPIGYTTFWFDGDRLTVMPGADDNYEITGVNAADEEYTDLPVATTAEGWFVYENAEAYRLYVSVKKSGGTYVFGGQGNDMAIAVKKEATDPAQLLLCGLELTSSFTAPITVKKDSATTATITALAGHVNTLSDVEFNNADLYGPTEDGGDGTNPEYAESAVIKCKDYANVTVNGSGTLNLICSSKNALKVGEYGSLSIADLTLNVSSVNHGISSDNTLKISSGSINVNAASDAIRSDPDPVDPEAGCAGNIVITGGTYVLTAGADGIQAAQDLTITDGKFHIQAGQGWDDPNFDKDTMSCKGLKTSGTIDEEAGEVATNQLTVTGGTFVLNTADDAIHSDCNITIAGGTYVIQTGDDGVHADAALVLGAEGADDDAIDLSVLTCYEGLEGATVEIYSGTYDVVASDDGINAAGDSTETETMPGWPGGGGTGGSSNYYITVYGGDITVHAGGDGLDSNGNLSLLGGTVVVWGAQNSNADTAIDCDGSFLVNGATVLAAGSRQMNPNPASGSQPYIRTNTSVTAGRTVNVRYNNETVFNILAAGNASSVFYSSPDMTSSSGWSIVVDNSAVIEPEDPCANGHTAVEDPAVAATCTQAGLTAGSHCSVCGDVLTPQTIVPATGHTVVEDAAVAPTCTEPGLSAGSHCSVCDTVLVPQSVVAAAGHAYELTDSVEPTESALGSATYTCTVCGDSYTEVVDELGCPSAMFSDVEPLGHWSHAGIDYCVANDLMNGFPDSTFRPNGDLTRAQLVTILYRVEGEPEATYADGTFADVAATDWFAAAVAWAAENGVVEGYPDGTFRPDKAITREQIATILYRMEGAPETAENALNGFPDAEDVHEYAVPALNWAVTQGHINGVAIDDVNYLKPLNTATRAQIAAIMMRWLEA